MASEKGLAESLVDAEDRLARLQEESVAHQRRVDEVGAEIARHKAALGNLVGSVNRVKNILIGKRLVRIHYQPVVFEGKESGRVSVTVEPVEVI